MLITRKLRRPRGQPLKRLVSPSTASTATALLVPEVLKSLESKQDASTNNYRHVRGKDCLLLDAVNATPETHSNSIKPDHQASPKQSFLSHASEFSDTTIQMERTQAPENGSGLDLPQPQADNSDGRAGSSAHNENAESSMSPLQFGKRIFLTIVLMIADNLFFRDDDGSVLAVRISCILGRELLCGLSQQTSPLTYFPALPLVSASPAHRDDDGPSATAHIPATLPSGTPTVSTHTSAPARATSAARGGELRPKLSAAIVDTDAWVDGIFSSSNGTSYDRNWISNNDVDDEQVLKGTASKHKLDVLIRYGAVVVGDKLCVTYNLSTNPKTVEGVVSD